MFKKLILFTLCASLNLEAMDHKDDKENSSHEAKIKADVDSLYGEPTQTTGALSSSSSSATHSTSLAALALLPADRSSVYAAAHPPARIKGPERKSDAETPRDTDPGNTQVGFLDVLNLSELCEQTMAADLAARFELTPLLSDGRFDMQAVAGASGYYNTALRGALGTLIQEYVGDLHTLLPRLMRSSQQKFEITARRRLRASTRHSGPGFGHLREEPNFYRTARFSPDGTLLVTLEGSNYIDIWDVKTGDLLCSIDDYHKAPKLNRHGMQLQLENVYINKQNSRVIALNSHGDIFAWKLQEVQQDAHTTIQAQPMTSYENYHVKACRFNEDGTQFVTVGELVVRIWNAEDMTIAKELPYKGTWKMACLCDHASHIGFIGINNVAQIWNVFDGELLHSFPIPSEHPFVALACSNDGSRLITFARTTDPIKLSASIWDTATHQLIKSYTGDFHLFDSPMRFNADIFSPDSRYIKLESVNEGRFNTNLIEARDGSLIRKFHGHDSLFSADNNYIIHYDYPDIRIQTVKDGTTVATLRCDTELEYHFYPLAKNYLALSSKHRDKIKLLFMPLNPKLTPAQLNLLCMIEKQSLLHTKLIKLHEIATAQMHKIRPHHLRDAFYTLNSDMQKLLEYNYNARHDDFMGQNLILPRYRNIIFDFGILALLYHYLNTFSPYLEPYSDSFAPCNYSLIRRFINTFIMFRFIYLMYKTGVILK